MPSRYGPPIDVQLRQLTKVAVMYHEQGVRQAQIADALGLSQAKVSRLLKRAAQLGVVRTTVSIAPGLHTELEGELERAFGLAEAVIVDVEDDADETEQIAAIGGAGAAYLETAFTGADRVGIASWSQTLLATVDRMRPAVNPTVSEVVQLLGGIGVPEVQTQAQRLASELARMLGGQAYYVQAPGVVADRGTRDSLLREPGLQAVMERWRELTAAVVGIGSIDPSDLLAESGNAFDASDRETLLADGAVGDICHRVFRVDGSAIEGDVDARTISIPIDDFRRIPRRIGIAGGERKIGPVRGALAGGWVTTLITDARTARALL
ncbi:sugar-binding transcriptional regulator [Ruania rhizosphaerae]|uniref:sugar-binding transcriptional regulator n=1 Tax=Ruania rhizosphaerae TaxID=1840413 RepID=UPI001F2A324F|nr:sugar-binding transcriptional regulator [Ruania rhizosphaerae]